MTEANAWFAKTGALLYTVLATAMVTNAATAAGNDRSALVLEDAERLATLLDDGHLPSEQQLQAAYLGPGTPGIEIFTPHRIESAEHLAHAIAADPAGYQRAAELCLPEARELQAEASALIARVGEILDQPQAATAYVVFGAGNSGGTADARGLVLGLEVICREARSPTSIAQRLREFIAHEMTHVHQSRVMAAGDEDNLLRQSLIEGFADFVMERALHTARATPDPRAEYGLAHEADLWQAFWHDVEAGRTESEWLYRPVTTRPGQPPDMGYWIGKRICEAYYVRATNKPQAIRELLELRDPRAILAASGYPGDPTVQDRMDQR